MIATADLDAMIAAALRPVERVRVAYLFGSRASGRPRPDSDLDVGVAYARGLGDANRERARRDVVAALTDALGRVGETADVVDLERSGAGVAFRAVREGRCVLARDERERVGLVARICRLYDDDAPRRALVRRAAVAVGRRLARRDRA